MAKNIRRMLATVLVMCMFVSALPMQALAAEGDGTVTDTETVTEGGLTTEITTTTTQTTDEATGNVTVTVEIQKDTTGTTDTGADLERHETTTESQTKSEDGEVVGESTVIDGKETIENIIPHDKVGATVEVPTTDQDNPETEKVDNVNTETFGPDASSTTTGDLKEGEDDKSYDQTTTTVTPGTVTVTTTEVERKETVVEKIVDENGNVIQGTDLDYVHSVVKPTNGNGADQVDNDLFVWVFRGNRVDVPEKGEKVDLAEGYEYQYLGAGNTSQYFPTFLFTEPQAGFEDEEPIYVGDDGTEYYLGRWSAEYAKNPEGYTATNGITEFYMDGKKVELGEVVPTVFGVPQQFILVDGATNELITTYCADANTETVPGYNYNIENLEDADYYNDEQAAMIRTIAENGYWGTASGEVGSLDTMKEMMRKATDKDGNAVFTEEEVQMLTDGIALSATQLAIWNYSNADNNDMVFVNAQYSNNRLNENGELTTSWANELLKDPPTKLSDDTKESIALLYKLYTHLISMDPTPVRSEDKQPTTNDTIINVDNFVDNMSVTVIEKAENHDNNQDSDDTNDAYVTNLTFALVVKPSTENGDDLVVTVVDKNNNVIASGRIAGTPKEGETLQYLKPDEKGNYCFEGITMIEGEQNFKLNLEGIQNLKEGVYLYTSEVRTGDEGEDISSQTLVGLAGGKHAVNVEMSIKFDLQVDNAVVATERVWHYEDDPTTEPEEPVPFNEEPEPGPEPMIFRMDNEGLQEIPEEPVPLAAPVSTGDNSGMWIAVVILAVFGIVAINLFDKKRQHEAF